MMIAVVHSWRNVVAIKIVSNTPKFVVFDIQKLSETQHMIFGADYVLIRPKSTGCTLHLADSHFRLSIGQLILLAPFNPFRLTLDTESSYKQKQLDCDVLHFRLSGLSQSLIDGQQFADIKSMLNQSRHALLYEGPEITEIGKQFNAMKNTFELSQLLNLLHILDNLSKLDPKQCLLKNCIEISHVKRTEDKLTASLLYIKTHLTDALTVAEVAKHLYMAESTFSRFFHANMGVTFWQYVIEQRIRLASKLLVQTDKSISYIAAEVGFTSISGFNCKFKQLIKSTPREYRLTHTDMRLSAYTSKSVKNQIKKQLLSLV